MPRTTRVLVGLMLAGCALLLVGVIADASARAAAPVPPQPGIEVRAQFGDLGELPALAVSADGSPAVVDSKQQRVIRVDPNGDVLSEWGPDFGDDTPASGLAGLAAGTHGDWYLLDRGSERILHLDGDGRAVGVIDLARVGTYGPRGVAVDRAGNVYLADTGQNRILQFDSNGALIRSIETLAPGPAQANQPVSVASGPGGGLFVGSLQDPRIAGWDASLQPVSGWKLDTAALGIAVDRLGRVFVPDPAAREVRMFDADGNLLAEIGGAANTPFPVDGPSRVGLTPDGSALWVLGRNGLARVDLVPLAGVTEPAPYPRWADPAAAAGAALAVASLTILGWPVVRRWFLAPPRLAGAPDQPGRTPLGGVLLEGRNATLIGLVGWVAAAAVAVRGEGVASGANREDAVPWLLAAALLGLASVKALEAGEATGSLRAASTCRSLMPAAAEHLSRRERLVGVGLLALGGLAALVSTSLLAGSGSIPIATSIWADALALVAAGAVVVGGRVGRQRRRWRVLALVEVGCLAVVVLVAVWLRLPDLATVPPDVFIDEGGIGNSARQILAGGMPSVFGLGWWRLPAMTFSFNAITMRLFGDDLFGLRVASVVEGMLSIVVLYLLTRRLWGARPALLAAAFLAIAAWHIHFSRMGTAHMEAPLAMLLAVYFLVRSIQDRRLIDWVLCGFAVGLSMEVYYAGRVTPLVVAAYLAYRVGTGRREFVRTHAAGLVALAFSALVFVGPMAVVYARNPAGFNDRANQVSIMSTDPALRGASGLTAAAAMPAVLGSQARATLEAFHIRGDSSIQYAHAGAPLFDWWTGALLAMSALAILFRPGSSHGFLLAACVWLPLFVGSVLTENPLRAERELIGVPFLMIGPALMAEYAWSGVTRVGGHLGAFTFGGMAMILFGLALQANMHDYFDVEIVRRMPADQVTQFGLEARALQDRYRSYVIGHVDMQSEDVMNFLLPNPDVVQVGDAPLALPLDSIPADKGVAFLVMNGAADHAQRLAAIEQVYPVGRVETVNQPPGSRASPAFTVYLVDKAELAAVNTAVTRD